MSRSEKKELLVMLLCCILNTIISFAITGLCGVTNTIILKSYSSVYGDITWEVIIFMGLMFIEALLYDYFFSGDSSLSNLFIN